MIAVFRRKFLLLDKNPGCGWWPQDSFSLSRYRVVNSQSAMDYYQKVIGIIEILAEEHRLNVAAVLHRAGQEYILNRWNDKIFSGDMTPQEAAQAIFEMTKNP